MAIQPVNIARIGLTGGLGSGKSTVAGIFRTLGIQTIDADQIARQLMQPGSDQFDCIVKYFGEKILDPNGNIDRAHLGHIVFSDPHKRNTLESILHPPIRKEMDRQIQPSDHHYCILEIPLLIETGQHHEMDRVIVVTCNHETKVNRLHHRGMDTATINKILSIQADEQTRTHHADDIINNNGTLPDLENQVHSLHKKYRNQYSA